MADVLRLDALIQHTNKDGEGIVNWDIPLPVNLLIYDETTRIIKKGDGANSFEDLPVWLDLNQLENVATIGEYIENDIFTDENIDKLLIITSDGKISLCEHLTNTKLLELINQLPTLLATSGGSNIHVPIITGPIKKSINSTFFLKAVSFSAYEGEQAFEFEWTLPDDSLVSGNIIEYEIPDDIGLIGTTLTFKCRAKSIKFGFYSKLSLHNVLIDNTDGPVVLFATYSGYEESLGDFIISIDEQEL